jgi:hypothetical protein
MCVNRLQSYRLNGLIYTLPLCFGFPDEIFILVNDGASDLFRSVEMPNYYSRASKVSCHHNRCVVGIGGVPCRRVAPHTFCTLKMLHQGLMGLILSASFVHYGRS